MVLSAGARCSELVFCNKFGIMSGPWAFAVFIALKKIPTPSMVMSSGGISDRLLLVVLGKCVTPFSLVKTDMNWSSSI